MKMNRCIKIIAFSTSFSSLLFLSIASSSAKEYYKWVDSKGSTHYTSTPPPKTAKKQGKIDTYGYRSATTSTQTPTPQNVAPPAATSNTAQAMDQQQREANEALQKKDAPAP